MLAVNLTRYRDPFDFEVALPWLCCASYAHAVSSASSVFCDAQCTVLAYTNVLLVLEVLVLKHGMVYFVCKMLQFDIHIAYVHAHFLYSVTLYII